MYAPLEKFVLEALMLNSDVLHSLLSQGLIPGMFQDEKNQTIFEAINILYQNSNPVDLLTVIEQLKDMQMLAKAGGKEYLTELTTG